VGFRYTTAMNTKTIPAYFVLDASVTAVLGSWELGISGLNLLNTPYISLEEFPVPGIELQVEARIRL
jgi:outer membrane receptor protein involved in Fe transport